jgi:hypothetical protein
MQRTRFVVATTMAMVALVAAPVLAAPSGLPSTGTQVNKDPAHGIDPAKAGGRTAVAGGSLTAAAAEVPWIAFEQKASAGQHIFVRVFKSGAWHTQGQSLNIDPSVKAEAPSIDFAGPGRSVPWVSWYEPSSALGGATQVFASRFCAAANAVCGAGNTWIPEGQDRSGGSLIPSLNINTDKDAEDPSVAGGTLAPGGDPGPWVTWEEKDGNVAGSGNHDQIFVSKPVKVGSAGAACPVGTKPSGGDSVSFFCWQQVGIERIKKTGSFTNPTDPTLDIDPSRAGVEPDIAFTGPNDNVAWVVWYEQGPSHLGLRGNEQVFAAKIVANIGADGGGQWQAVGRGTAALTETLDTSGSSHFGDCSTSTTTEDACSLNKIATHNAEDPRVAAGTLVSGNPTVPWITWAEDIGGGKHAIFVSRLVGADHFELFNAGQPVSNITRDATTPDIEFLGNVPYVSWVEAFPGGAHRLFVGHFTGGAVNPAFHLDTPNGVKQLPKSAVANVTGARQPISTTCQANPFTSDGSSCPGGSGFTFFSFTTAGTPHRIFAQRR